MARLDRRRRLDADSDGVERRRRIHQLKAEQATLKVELAAAKLRLGIGVHQWSYERESNPAPTPEPLAKIIATQLLAQVLNFHHQ